MKTSQAGIEFLERHEGVVLKAYRDPVGIWTIGAGLTAASGVVTPVAGMTITKTKASKLLARALERNYEPSVAKAMPGAAQHEFDGGVSFHWNTGAIHRASWVAKWRARDWPGVAAKIKLWNKGGGRVLPGLVRRRDEEYQLIRYGKYVGAVDANMGIDLAREVVPIEPEEMAAIRKELEVLGYEKAGSYLGVSRAAIIQFQRDHDLTPDGIIGRATLSTLQRRIDARAKSGLAVTTSAAGITATQAGQITDALADMPILEGGGTAVLALGLFWAARLAFSYRDVVAAKTHRRLPRLAAKLRSF